MRGRLFCQLIIGHLTRQAALPLVPHLCRPRAWDFQGPSGRPKNSSQWWQRCGTGRGSINSRQTLNNLTAPGSLGWLVESEALDVWLFAWSRGLPLGSGGQQLASGLGYPRPTPPPPRSASHKIVSHSAAVRQYAFVRFHDEERKNPSMLQQTLDQSTRSARMSFGTRWDEADSRGTGGRGE